MSSHAWAIFWEIAAHVALIGFPALGLTLLICLCKSAAMDSRYEERNRR